MAIYFERYCLLKLPSYFYYQAAIQYSMIYQWTFENQTFYAIRHFNNFVVHLWTQDVRYHSKRCALLCILNLCLMCPTALALAMHGSPLKRSWVFVTQITRETLAVFHTRPLPQVYPFITQWWLKWPAFLWLAFLLPVPGFTFIWARPDKQASSAKQTITVLPPPTNMQFGRRYGLLCLVRSAGDRRTPVTGQASAHAARRKSSQGKTPFVSSGYGLVLESVVSESCENVESADRREFEFLYACG